MAGEMRDWIPHLPRTEQMDYTDSNIFTVSFKMQIIEDVQTKFCHLRIGYNPYFGHMMFINGEIQISELDWYTYHEAMWQCAVGSLARDAHVLVVGDGDGGFTDMPKGNKIDIVERDGHVINAGTAYFGARWDRVNLIHKSLDEFYPVHRYDAAILAIDDGFNQADEFDADLDRIASWIRPGGRLVAQAGTDLDPKHHGIAKRYVEWAEKKGFRMEFRRAFIQCYFCYVNFFVAVIDNAK